MRRHMINLVALVVMATAVVADAAEQPARKKILPSWKEIGKIAVETLFEDVPERMAKEFSQSQEVFKMQSMNAAVEAPASQNLAAIDISGIQSCDEAVNELILHITQMKSIFYFLVNGWYLGQLGDYSSCRTFTNNGQYILATINGEYTADYPFTRGSYGKYIDFSTQMGLCVPKQCDKAAVEKHIGPLLVRYAEEAHWSNVTVDYQLSWNYVHTEARSFDSTGKIVGLSIFGFLLMCVVVGSCVELSSLGDDPEFDRDMLKELNRFKSTD